MEARVHVHVSAGRNQWIEHRVGVRTPHVPKVEDEVLDETVSGGGVGVLVDRRRGGVGERGSVERRGGGAAGWRGGDGALKPTTDGPVGGG